MAGPTKAMSKWAGVSRRASASTFAKSASAKTSDALGPMKLRTPEVKPPKAPKAQQPARQATQNTTPKANVSFGTTGYSKEDWYGPL